MVVLAKGLRIPNNYAKTPYPHNLNPSTKSTAEIICTTFYNIQTLHKQSVIDDNSKDFLCKAHCAYIFEIIFNVFYD